MRNPQHKKHGSHSKLTKVDNRQLHTPHNTPDSQCDQHAKEKYRKEAVAIEKCAETKGFQTKIAQALKSDNHKGAVDACEDVLMSCVGLSMACAKQQIPFMLDRAKQKKARGQLEASKHTEQIMKDRADSESGSYSNPGLFGAPDDVQRAPRLLRNSSMHKDTSRRSEHLERGAVPRPVEATESPKKQGVIELCNHNGLRVVLDVRSNSRQMTFGDKAWEKLVQTAVNCKGTPAPTCMAAAKSSCEMGAERCPCEFQMQKLPPLDHEYQYIAKEVLQKDETALDVAFGSIRDHAMAVMPRKLRMALVGLGGGMIAQYLISHSTQLSIDAIELNSDVIAAARAFFGIAKAESNGRLRVLEGDGLSRLNEGPPASYGVVVVDCFGKGRVPENCRSEAFVEAAYRAMEPGAEMLQNVLTSRPDDADLDKLVRKDLEDLLNAYRKVFGQHAVELQSKWAHGDNAVVRAQKRGSVK